MEKIKFEVPIVELLEKTTMKAEPCTSYVNHARLTLMNTELFIDFILVAPSLPGFEPSATHVQRIIYPVANARAMIIALESVVSSWEQATKEETSP